VLPAVLCALVAPLLPTQFVPRSLSGTPHACALLLQRQTGCVVLLLTSIHSSVTRVLCAPCCCRVVRLAPCSHHHTQVWLCSTLVLAFKLRALVLAFKLRARAAGTRTACPGACVCAGACGASAAQFAAICESVSGAALVCVRNPCACVRLCVVRFLVWYACVCVCIAGCQPVRSGCGTWWCKSSAKPGRFSTLRPRRPLVCCVVCCVLSVRLAHKHKPGARGVRSSIQQGRPAAAAGWATFGAGGGHCSAARAVLSLGC
jgi:hypothetical protein